METIQTVKFTRANRNAVAKTSDNGPSLQTWLDRVAALGLPVLTGAVEGIWCGRSGEARLELPGAKSMLCVGWHNGRVEFSYLS